MRKVVENELPERFNFLRREWDTMNKSHLLKNISPTTLTIYRLNQLRTLRMVDFPESPDPNRSTLRYGLAMMLRQKTTSTYLDL